MLIHPTYPAASAERGYVVPRPDRRLPLRDRAGRRRACCSTGCWRRCLSIRFILSHAGGALPALAHRIEIFDDLTRFRENYPEGARACLGRLYYDTALSGDATVLRALRDLAGPDRILFGTDYPYIPDAVAESETAGTDGYEGFDETARAMMEHGNARRLFPRLAEG